MDLNVALKIIKLTQNSYSQIAESFADSRNSSWAEIDEAIKKYVKPGDKILDLGCGNGRLLKSLSKIPNIAYLGIDNCKPLIDKNQDNKNKKIYFVCQDILNLANLPDNSFSITFMVASFHHIPSQKLREKVLTNLHRILKPGGIIIMTNWNLWQPSAKKSVWHNKLKHNYQLKNNLKSLGFKDVVTLWQNKHSLYYYAFTLGELKKLFLSAGFSILENSYVRRGQKTWWWNGFNILTVGKKE